MKEKRTVEFVLGLIGGIFGIIGGILGLSVGGLGSALGSRDFASIFTLGVFAILFSILGIVGSIIVSYKHKLGGIFMIVASIGGLISISYVYILPFILLIIAGISGLIRKVNKE